MPQREIINFRSQKFWGVNTNFKVGPGKDNGMADVKLIQTLFRYLSIASFNTKDDLGYQEHDLPEVTGICDTKTTQVIWKFQERNTAKLLSVDGAIHPASYEGRVIRTNHWDHLIPKPRQPVMTITLLHVYAWYAASIFDSSGYYINKLVAITPELKPWLT